MELTAESDPVSIHRRCMLCRVVSLAVAFQSCQACGMHRCGQCDVNSKCWCGWRRGCVGCGETDRPQNE